MYTFDENTANDQNYLPAGIHENVELKDIVFEGAKSDGTGEKVLRFNFADQSGNLFTHTEFPIDDKRTLEVAKNWAGVDPKEHLANEYKDQSARIMHISEQFVARKAIIDGLQNISSFADLANKLITTMGKNYVGMKVRVKIVLNKKDFTVFPRKTFSPFIQNMEMPNTLSLTKHDRVTPMPTTSEENLDPMSGASAEEVPAVLEHGGQNNDVDF